MSIFSLVFGWVKSYLFLDAVLSNKTDNLPIIDKNLDRIYTFSMAYVVVVLTCYNIVYIV